MRWFAWALAWGWALSGCAPDVPEGRFACAESGQCPTGWACRVDEGLCYRHPSTSSPDKGEGGTGGVGGPREGVKIGTGGSAGKRAGGAGQSGNAGRAGEDAAGGSSGARNQPQQPEGCAESCSGDKPFCDGASCVECLANSAPHCDGEQPVVCQDEHWLKKPACAGNNPVCSNGTCASMRLVGGIAVSVPGAGNDKLRLVEPALEVTPRACAPVQDKTYCVRGGLR